MMHTTAISRFLLQIINCTKWS